MTRATPDTWQLEIHDDDLLPNLSLVRRVVPENGTTSRTVMFVTDDDISEVSESRFGDPDEDADPGCIFAGLEAALPAIDIIPPTIFWDRVAAPDGIVALSDLFVAPRADRLGALQADFIVIAYHARTDVDSFYATVLVEGLFGDEDMETAAIIVIDLDRRAIIHGSKISFSDKDFVYHVFTIPLVFFTLDPSDFCKNVGYQAGVAIAKTMPGRAVRALVVVAGEDPYEAASRTQWMDHGEDQ